MIKTILLAGTMIVAAPAIAQTAPAKAPTAATPAQTAPTTAPAGTTGATTAAPSEQIAPVDTAPVQAADASTAPPAQSQVAQVVEQQFATYDKDGNGALSKTEFASWMTALKSQSAAAPKETPAQATAWNDAAFKQADGDKSATVSKTELTGFLVKGASQAS
jgi:hypothetical protein